MRRHDTSPTRESVRSPGTQALARIEALPIVKHLGLEIGLDDTGTARAWLSSVEPFHLGGLEEAVLNGGIVLSLLDAVVASAALVHVGRGRCGTVQLNAQIARPVPARRSVAVGRITDGGRRLLFAEAWIEHPIHGVMARASAVLARLPCHTRAGEETCQMRPE